MSFDLITFGRASIDLYSNNIGSEFNDIKELSTSIGGPPVNISVGAQRLGLKTGIISAIGPDPIGGFIKNSLNKEGVDTTHLKIIEGTKSAAVVCGIIPPDKFPLVFYRDNAPDKKITPEHIKDINFSKYRSFLMTGTSFAVEPSRTTAFKISEKAKKNEIPVFLDLDFRANLWGNILDFGSVLRDYLKLTDIVIGTEEEVLSLNLTDVKQVRIKNDSITQPKIAGNLNDSIKIILNEGVKLLLVKTGAKGVIAYYNDGSVLKVPGFSVKVTNVLGAGDAFAGGFIYGYLNGWDDYKSLRLANACGAWLVTKQGCCNFAPYYDEIINFIEEKGGF